MTLLTDDLVKKAPYSFDKTEKLSNSSDFYKALMEELCFHFDNNTLYKKFCIKKNFNPHNFSGELKDIPPVQVSVFKNLGQQLNSVDNKDIKLVLQSSATSGVPSSITVDKTTAKRQARCMTNVISSYIGNKRSPFLVMDIDPKNGFSKKLGARFAAVSGYLNFASKVGFFLKEEPNGQSYFDVDGINAFIKDLDQNEPVVIFGFTYILFSEVIKALENKNIHFALPKNSKVIHIGGWKKLESQKVTKSEFNNKLSSIFGIDPLDVIDIYGFTEQMGLNYPDCKCGCKHAPLYSEVIVRNIGTGEVLPPGKEGLLEFISPLPHSYPGNVILTDDVGIIETSDCSEGRSGTRFRVVGRLKNAEVRGCGDILSSKLKFSDRSTNKLNKSPLKDESLKLEFFSEFSLEQSVCNQFIEFSDSDKLLYIIRSLKQHQRWLQDQPIDGLIGLINKVSKKWSSNSFASSNVAPSLESLKTKGGAFLSSWCSIENLTSMMDEGLFDDRHHVDRFISIADSTLRSRKAVSKGLVGHWLAGNVQVLGMFVLIQSILTKNVNLIKVSSQDNGVFVSLINSFKDEYFETNTGVRIEGNELLKTIAVVYYNHTNTQLGHIMSEQSDIRVAWGGREAVETVSAYPSKYDCSDLIMGPKLSFSVVANEYLQDERKLKKLCRKIAVDASVFDQTGCASAHNVFVEEGGKFSVQEFTKFLSEGMKKELVLIPRGEMSPQQLAAVHSIRGIYDFKGEVLGDDNLRYTVIYSDDCELTPPAYSRVVFVHPVDSIDRCVQFVNDDIQTIGLAADGEKANKFITEASYKGAVRFPTCGKMLNFESPWDGMYLVNRMVKWITVGAPLT